MTEQNSQIVPATPVIIPPKPSGRNYELERDANHAVEYLTRFTSNPRLDPELRIALNDIKNTVKNLKITMIRITEEAQSSHDKLVEIVSAQRFM